MLINKYRIVGDVAYIELTKGQETMIDVADLEKTLIGKWHAIANMMGGYYAASSGPVYLHRWLLEAPKGMYVDHVNHNTLDNRRSNLKLCTNQENNTNRKGAFSSSKTGIRGVSDHKLPPYTRTSNRNIRKTSPDGMMYIFRCHCVTCKASKYFPHTEEGLEEAKAFSDAHYAAMKTSTEK